MSLLVEELLTMQDYVDECYKSSMVNLNLTASVQNSEFRYEIIKRFQCCSS